MCIYNGLEGSVLFSCEYGVMLGGLGMWGESGFRIGLFGANGSVRIL
jgi:hypothetical protein